MAPWLWPRPPSHFRPRINTWLALQGMEGRLCSSLKSPSRHPPRAKAPRTTSSGMVQAGSYLLHILRGLWTKKKKGNVRGCLAESPGVQRAHQMALPDTQDAQPLTVASLTLASSSLRGRRCRCRRSTSSISYTLISKGSFREPARGGGRSTHCPGRLGLRPKAAASGSGAGISLRRCRPETGPGTPQARVTSPAQPHRLLSQQWDLLL